MSDRKRSESGEYVETVSDNDILLAFDAADAPVLTSGELADRLPISRSAVNHRLNRMRERGLVDRKETGARAVAWWAEVAPRLSAESATRVEQAREEIESGNIVALEDV